MAKELEERFSYVYPYAYLQEIPGKISVSDLKRPGFSEEDAVEMFPEEQMLPLIPEFMQPEKEELKGAARGTAYHRVLEKLDYSRAGSRKRWSNRLLR